MVFVPACGQKAIKPESPLMESLNRMAATADKRSKRLDLRDFHRPISLYARANSLTSAMSMLQNGRIVLRSHLPLAHWRSRNRPVFPFVLANLDKPGATELVLFLQMTGEYGRDEDVIALHQWWSTLPPDAQTYVSWRLMEITARTQSQTAGRLLLAATNGPYRAHAWTWIARMPEECVPMQPEAILRDGDAWDCCFAAQALVDWGHRGPLVEKLLRKALAGALKQGDETLATIVRRYLRQIQPERPGSSEDDE
jgi:hypothetical protein